MDGQPHLGGHAGLPDAGRPDDRHQPGTVELRRHGLQLLVPPVEAGRGPWHGRLRQAVLLPEGAQVDLDRLAGGVDPELVGELRATRLVGANGAGPVACGVESRDQGAVRAFVQGCGRHPLLGSRHGLAMVARRGRGLDDEVPGPASQSIDALAVHLEPLRACVREDVRTTPRAERGEELAGRSWTTVADHVLGPVEQPLRLADVHRTPAASR